MASKLDKSLEEIAQDVKSTRSRGGARGRGRQSIGRNGSQTNAAVSKSSIASKQKGPKASTASAIPLKPKGSKIIIYNFPPDVTIELVKNYFKQTLNMNPMVRLVPMPGKKPSMTAFVEFKASDAAGKARTALDGQKIDNIYTIKIEEIMMDGADQPAPKSLGDRLTGTKSAKTSNGNARDAAKPAKKATDEAGRGGRKGGKRGGRSARPAKKTAEELDAEMEDYFVPGGASTNGADATQVNGVAADAAVSAPAAGGEATMVDEVL